MKFYTYRQNNSGGNFDFNEEAGITLNVIVGAEDQEFANFRAEQIGLYFNGCASGRDCSCCGDRWSTPFFLEGCEFPSIYGEPVSLTTKAYLEFEAGKQVCVHYADGRKEWF